MVSKKQNQSTSAVTFFKNHIHMEHPVVDESCIFLHETFLHELVQLF